MNKLTVQAHAEWRIRLAQSQTAANPIDDDFDDLIKVDPYVSGTNNRRSDKELARVLELIDDLPISSNGKEGDA